jgi:hypothetical protein
LNGRCFTSMGGMTIGSVCPRPGSEEAGGLTEFQKRTEILRAEWEKLKVARDQLLEDPRHKVFAHLELVEVPIEYPKGLKD